MFTSANLEVYLSLFVLANKFLVMLALLRKIRVKQAFYMQCRNAGKKKTGKDSRCEKSKKNFKGYKIVLAAPKDTDAIMNLMRTDFFPSEPMSVGLGFCVPPAALEQEVIDLIKAGYTMLAKCRNKGHIIGGCVNYQILPGGATEYEKMACEEECENLKNQYLFLAYVKRNPDLFHQYKVHTIFELGQLFVKQSARKRGIAYKLLTASRELAADCGFKVMKTDATSHYTALLCEKMGMKMVNEIPYCAFVDDDANQIIEAPPPHKSLKVYIDDNLQMSALKFRIEQDKKNAERAKKSINV